MDKTTLNELNAIAGRTLADDEILAIQERVGTAMHDLEAEDPEAWRVLPVDERASRAAELAQMRYMATIRAEQRETIMQMAAAHPEVVRAHFTSSAVLNGYVPEGSGSANC